MILKFPEVTLNSFIFVSGLVVKVLVLNPGVLCSTPLGASKVDSAFHLSKVIKMSTRNFWELNGKK